MQNRFVGDIGDFGKYGMLRCLISTGYRLGFNWYLTPDGTDNAGGFIDYLLENTPNISSVIVEGDWKIGESEISQGEVKLEETPLYKELRQYRYEISKAAGIKPYMVFTNAELVALISAKPRTLNDLKRVPGFGNVKCERYGKAILEIIKRHS